MLDFIIDNEIKIDRIDYLNYLIGYFIFHENQLSENDTNYLIEWIDRTDFTNKTNSERRTIYKNLIKNEVRR